MRIKLRELRSLIRNSLIKEGGLKLPQEKRRDLTPSLVKRTAATYIDFIHSWNAWLAGRGEVPVKPVGLSGSSTYADMDLKDNPDQIYGDVDYLVSFPVSYTSGEFANKRKANAETEKKYSSLLAQFISTTKPKQLDPELSLSGSPLQVIVDLGNDVLVQVDTTITHPEAENWMKGRYTPERGVKGYVTGKLYKALGDYLGLTIGTEGVLVRTKDGKRVLGNVRAGVDIRRISTNFQTFLLDIAGYLAPEVEPNTFLSKYPGLQHDNVNITDLALGIVGLAKTLDEAGLYREEELLASVLANFEEGLADAVDTKVARNINPEKQAKLLQLNDEQLQRVQRVFQSKL